MTDNFQVHGLAAAKGKRKKPVKSGPVTVVARAHPDVMKQARAAARGKDVRIEVQRDGSVILRNGAASVRY